MKYINPIVADKLAVYAVRGGLVKYANIDSNKDNKGTNNSNKKSFDFGPVKPATEWSDFNRYDVLAALLTGTLGALAGGVVGGGRGAVGGGLLAALLGYLALRLTGEKYGMQNKEFVKFFDDVFLKHFASKTQDVKDTSIKTTQDSSARASLNDLPPEQKSLLEDLGFSENVVNQLSKDDFNYLVNVFYKHMNTPEDKKIPVQDLLALEEFNRLLHLSKLEADKKNQTSEAQTSLSPQELQTTQVSSNVQPPAVVQPPQITQPPSATHVPPTISTQTATQTPPNQPPPLNPPPQTMMDSSKGGGFDDKDVKAYLEYASKFGDKAGLDIDANDLYNKYKTAKVVHSMVKHTPFYKKFVEEPLDKTSLFAFKNNMIRKGVSRGKAEEVVNNLSYIDKILKQPEEIDNILKQNPNPFVESLYKEKGVEGLKSYSNTIRGLYGR